MKFLVTGGAGFIGSHLVARLLSQGHGVTVIDDFCSYYDPAIKRDNLRPFADQPAFRLIEGDVRDRGKVAELFSGERFDVIVHLAARVGVRPSVVEPWLYDSVNGVGTVTLLEEARKAGVGHFVLASSSTVYGGNSKLPFSEDDPLEKPLSPYAVSKITAEGYGRIYWELYRLPVTCLRFFTVYGPRQRPEMAIHKFARLIRADSSVTIYGDGSSARDYTYIDDINDGVMAAALSPDGFRIINLGDSRPIILNDLIEMIEARLGVEARVKYELPHPGEAAITYADITKAGRLLNYSPKILIEEGLDRFVAWFLDGHR